MIKRQSHHTRPLSRIGALLGLASLLVLAQPALNASADTTHPYLGQISLPTGTGVQPIAVDSAGDIYVWFAGQNEIGRFDANGNPVNFSGLGTNVLDGKGGFDCPNTPSDCDRAPTGGFSAGGPFGSNTVAIDTSGGPANGYIYVGDVTAQVPTQYGANYYYGIDVFNSSGKYLTSLDDSKATPLGGENGLPEALSVSPNGTLVVDYEGGRHIDAFAPVDGNPAHDQFVGQLRVNLHDGITGAFNPEGAVADSNYIYFHRGNSYGDIPYWFKYPISELSRPTGNSVWINFSQAHPYSGLDSGPFGNGGGGYEVAGVDPATHHLYLLAAGGGSIAEWDAENHQIGPPFGTDSEIGSAAALAFDHSGGPHNGDIYVRGAASSSNLAVFGPPVIIPDVAYSGVTVGHTTAHITGTVDPAGGGAVTDCHIDYGLSGYGHSAPCVSGSGNEVSVDLSGLLTEATYHYRIVASNANGTNPGPDQTFRPNAVLGVSTDAATGITLNGATLNGKLDPDGIDTSYHFEYGIDTSYRQSTPTVDIGAGSGETAVTPAGIQNLQPGRTYHYRLVATNSLGTTDGSDQTFQTPASPTVSSLHASDVTATTAVLHAFVNPNSADTTYHFEYGPGLTYGSSAPAPDEDIGSGSSDQAVSVPLSNLQSGVIYHFRLIATNAWGTTTSGDVTFSFFPPDCPNAHVRGLTGSSYLPDCRAYELVSPGDAGAVTLYPGEVGGRLGQGNGQPIFLNTNFKFEAPNATGLAENPPRFGFFGSLGQLPGTDPPNALIDRYVATRTNSGWVTTYPGIHADQTVFEGRPRCDTQMDTCIDYRLGDPSLSDNQANPNPYVWDVSGRSLGRWPTNLDIVPNLSRYENGFDIAGDQQPSGDFSHYVFSSNNVAFAAGGLTSAPGSVYDNDVKSRTVIVASSTAGGAPIPQDSGTSDEFIKIPAVSMDGSHILMSTVAPFSSVHLYLRVNDSITYDIANGSPVKFVGMSRDGSTIVFTSSQRLTADDHDSSVDMFEWNESTNQITRVSQGDGNGDTDACNSAWSSGCGVAPLSTERPDLDNKIAPGNGDPYFYSPEQLDPKDPGVANERNLYVFYNGAVHYVATFPNGTEVDRMQISPDGSHAAFLTTARLTGYDNQGWREMYTYDPATEQIRCASCIPSGAPPSIQHPDPPGSKLSETANVMASENGPFMSNDGRVAFTTSDALVPQDTDGILDVYEYVGDRPQLISAGTGQRYESSAALYFPALDTGLESFSASGADLYFSTYDTLVPQDHNGNFVKFYDARTNGGFTPPQAALPCVAADECHGPSSEAPPPPQVGTSALLGGGGNQKAVPASKAHRRPRHRRHRRHRPTHRAR